MGHDVYLDGSCRVYIRKLSCEVLNSYIITKIVNGEGPAVTVVVSRIAKQTLCELVMDGHKRCYVQCRSGRLAGSLMHTVMPARRNSTANKTQTKNAKNLEAVVDLNVSDESIKEFFTKKQCTVIIKNPPDVQEVFDDLPKLRKRKLQNYLELSMSLSEVDNRNDKHVPIYRQVNQTNKRERTKPDLYEFDSDSENTKKKKRQKVRNSADTSVGFEKGMKDIMHAIEKNFKKNQARRRKNIKNRQVELYNFSKARHDENPKAILNKKVELLRTATAQKNVNSKVTVKQVLNEEIEFLSNAQLESYVSEANAVDSNHASTSNEEDFRGFDFRPAVETIKNQTGGQSLDFCVETKDKTTVNSKTIDGLFDEDTIIESESDLFGFSDESPISSQTKDETANRARATAETDDLFGFNSEILEPSPKVINNTRRRVETNDLFGFNSDSSEPWPKTKGKSPNRINIISNVVVNLTPGGVSYKDFDRPNANSTMVVTRRVKGSSSPWRPDLGVTRNPYLLQFKDTLLPNYNQEMVLNSTLSDKSCVNVSKTPTRPIETPNKVHQTSILKYFHGSKENHEVTKESSLFDDGDFSPIKSVKGHVDEDKENLPSPQKTSTALKKVKRDIIGQSAAPNRMPLSPLQNFTNRSKQTSQDDIEDYFGFDSITEEDKENTLTKPKKLFKSYFNKPVRFGDIVKQTVKKKVQVEDEPVLKEPTNNTVIEGESLAKDNPEQAENLPLRLFEDLEEKAPIRKYVPKRVRRPRQPSFVSENSDDENDHHKHKKRNARTKEEEKEFERWAASFNTMCQEVDEYALEIE